MRLGPGGHGCAPTWLRTTIRHVPMVSRTKPAHKIWDTRTAVSTRPTR